MLIRSLEDILEAAYDLQENSEMLFIHQNSVLNKRQPALVQQVEAGTEGRQRTKSVLSISTLEELSFVSAQVIYLFLSIGLVMCHVFHSYSSCPGHSCGP